MSTQPSLKHLMRRRVKVREPYGGTWIPLVVDLHMNEDSDNFVLTVVSETGVPTVVERLPLPDKN